MYVMIQGKNKKLITSKDKSFSVHAKKQRGIWSFPCLYNTNHMFIKNEDRTKFSSLAFQLLLYYFEYLEKYYKSGQQYNWNMLNKTHTHFSRDGSVVKNTSLSSREPKHCSWCPPWVAHNCWDSSSRGSNAVFDPWWNPHRQTWQTFTQAHRWEQKFKNE